MRFILLLLLTVLGSDISAQKPPPTKVEKGYFRSPVNHKIRLSGNFCELRNNHFHSGIDIKSLNQKTGDDILSVAEGYVSRISVKMGSYGNTIYIDHPCGLTSVYAHLESFDKKLDTIIRKKQYELKSFEVDFKLDSLDFPVFKGKKIATLGNSGFSHGPHLHFEIRDTKTEIPLNPLDFDFPVEDTKRPVITGVKLQILDIGGRPIKDQIIGIKHVENNYTSIDPITKINGWRCGFLIKGYDSQNGSSNKNGFYKIETFLDSTLIYSFTASHCSFDETIQMNGHIDYKARLNKEGFWHRGFLLPGNTLSQYDSIINLGQVKLFEKQTQRLKIRLSDIHGNQSVFETTILRDPDGTIPEEKKYSTLLKHKKANFFSNNGMRFFIPPECLYYDVPFQYSKETLDSTGILLKLGDKGDALKRPAKFELDIDLIPTHFNKEKTCLVFLDHFKEKYISAGGTCSNNSFSCPISYFGNYKLMQDTLPPTIQPNTWKKEWKQGEKMLFNVKDNLVVFGKARELDIEVLLDGEWVLAAYDLKNDRITIMVDEHFALGQHTLDIKAQDDRGNINELSKTMIVIP